MKKVVYSLALASALALTSVAAANELEVNGSITTSSTSARTEMKARLDGRMASSSERREEMKAELEAHRASSTAKRIEIQQNIAKRQVQRAGKVLSATISHLENILARVESRIAKVKAEGGATAESEGFVADVKVHLSAAKTSLAAFSSIQITSDKASENFQAVRNAAAEVKEHLKEAHESLMKAIRALKPGMRVNATSTLKVNN